MNNVKREHSLCCVGSPLQCSRRWSDYRTGAVTGTREEKSYVRLLRYLVIETSCNNAVSDLAV